MEINVARGYFEKSTMWHFELVQTVFRVINNSKHTTHYNPRGSLKKITILHCVIIAPSGTVKEGIKLFSGSAGYC